MAHTSIEVEPASVWQSHERMARNGLNRMHHMMFSFIPGLVQNRHAACIVDGLLSYVLRCRSQLELSRIWKASLPIAQSGSKMSW